MSDKVTCTNCKGEGYFRWMVQLPDGSEAEAGEYCEACGGDGETNAREVRSDVG